MPEPTSIPGVIYLFLTSIGSSVTAAGFAYGMMKEKVHRLEDDIRDLRESQKLFVPFVHFQAVVEPLKNLIETLQDDMDGVRRDIKDILRAVSRSGPKDS